MPTLVGSWSVELFQILPGGVKWFRNLPLHMDGISNIYCEFVSWWHFRHLLTSWQCLTYVSLCTSKTRDFRTFFYMDFFYCLGVRNSLPKDLKLFLKFPFLYFRFQEEKFEPGPGFEHWTSQFRLEFFSSQGTNYKFVI